MGLLDSIRNLIGGRDKEPSPVRRAVNFGTSVLPNATNFVQKSTQRIGQNIVRKAPDLFMKAKPYADAFNKYNPVNPVNQIKGAAFVLGKTKPVQQYGTMKAENVGWRDAGRIMANRETTANRNEDLMSAIQNVKSGSFKPGSFKQNILDVPTDTSNVPEKYQEAFKVAQQNRQKMTITDAAMNVGGIVSPLKNVATGFLDDFVSASTKSSVKKLAKEKGIAISDDVASKVAKLKDKAKIGDLIRLPKERLRASMPSEIKAIQESMDNGHPASKDQFKKLFSWMQENQYGARPQATESPLLQEARKYKSAEEFVKAQGTPIYHGTNAYFKEFDKAKIGSSTDEGLFGRGFYFGNTKEFAEIAPAGRLAKNVMEVYPSSNAKLFDISKIKSKTEMADLLNMSEDALIQDSNGIIRPVRGQSGQFTSHLQDLGYDGVVVSGRGAGAVETVIFEPTKIKTKSQLTDIYNQATGGTPKQTLVEMHKAPKEFESAGVNAWDSSGIRDVKLKFFREHGTKLDFNTPIAPKAQAMNTGAAKETFREAPTQPGRMLSETEKQINIQGKLPDGSPMYKPESPLALPEVKMSKQKDLEQAILGRSSLEPTEGGKKGVGMLGNLFRKGEAKVDDFASGMLQSDNAAVRGIGTALRGLAGTLGKSDDAVRNIAKFHGEVDTSRFLSEKLREAIPNDNASLQRIHSVLDPEMYAGKVADLTPQEKEAADILRKVADYINDTNYQNGLISQESWLKNRGGKYIARAYDEYDMPPEIADFMKTQSGKFDMNPFKKREELTEWKIDHSIKDPVYLMQKRLQQTMFNDATKKMFSWLKKTGYVSDEAKGGFTPLSDHKAYGDLAGKNVRKDIMESIRGLYFEHNAVQSAYDVLKWYDINPARTTLKKLKTIYNPAVRLGNRTGNYVFAWLGGIDPVSFTKNQSWASTAIKNNDPLVLKLRNDGIMGTGTHRGDIVKFADELRAGVTDKNALRKLDDSLSASYGFVDDMAKVAGVKTFLDRGFSYEEATRRASRMFQNYQTVGFLYDIGAKVPIFGNAFVRFQGALTSILKSAVVDHPVRAMGTLMAIKLIGDLSSAISGETDEDRATREGRVGQPHIPFTNIPLAIQTPWGEVNAARMLGVFANTPVGGASTVSDASKMLPIQAPSLRTIGSDPLIGPVLSTAVDTDFRGKSIADPESSKFKPSTLTDGEKNMNRAKYLFRQYNPSFFNDLTNLKDAATGQEDFYGKKRTTGHAIAGLFGVKTEQFGPEEAKNERIKQAQFDQYEKNDQKALISRIYKAQAAGEIDAETAKKRIDNVMKQSGEGSNLQDFKKGYVKNELTGGWSYIDKNGDLKNEDTEEQAKLGYEKAEFSKSPKNIQTSSDGKYVMRKNTSGDITVETKNQYMSRKLETSQTNKKNKGDFQGWLDDTRDLILTYKDMLNDPMLDETDRMTIENKMSTNLKEALGYLKKGGFTAKGGGGRKSSRLYNTSKSDTSKRKIHQNLTLGDLMKGAPKLKVIK